MVAVKPSSANLIGWWDQNEGSGNALDSHTSNLTMADNNGVGTGAGVVLTARDYVAGSNEYFSRASEAALQMGDIDATWVFWFNFDGGGSNEVLINKDDTTANREYAIIKDDSDVPAIFVFDGGNTIRGAVGWSAGLNPSTWYFCAAYHSATDNEVGISINAGVFETAATTGAAGTTTRPLWFGDREAASINLDGLLDEIAYFKEQLTLGNVEWLYNGGDGRSYSELVPPDFIPGMTIF